MLSKRDGRMPSAFGFWAMSLCFQDGMKPSLELRVEVWGFMLALSLSMDSLEHN